LNYNNQNVHLKMN